jgi:hypothetical protein
MLGVDVRGAVKMCSTFPQRPPCIKRVIFPKTGDLRLFFAKTLGGSAKFGGPYGFFSLGYTFTEGLT